MNRKPVSVVQTFIRMRCLRSDIRVVASKREYEATKIDDVHANVFVNFDSGKCLLGPTCMTDANAIQKRKREEEEEKEKKNHL